MRADLGPFGADLLLLVAGIGVLWGLGLAPRRPRALVPALGLAYLAGAALVPLALIALLTVGVPFNLVTIAAVALGALLLGLLVDRRRSTNVPANEQPTAEPTEDVPGASGSWRDPRGWPTDRLIVVGFAIVFGVYALIGLRAASVMPLDQWDAWTMWTRKAAMLTHYDSLVPGFFAAPSYEFTHQDYPLLFPVWEAIHFRAAGVVDTQAIHGHIWLLLVAFVWAAAYMVRDVARPLIWAPLLLAVAVAPAVRGQLLSAYADIPLGIFAALGAIAMGRWLVGWDRRQLALAALMLAATASMKNEGLVVAAAILASAGVVVLVTNRRRLIAYALAAFGVAVLVLPWRIWLAANDVSGDMPVSQGLRPGYLLDRSERIEPAVTAINGQLADQAQWLYILPLAVLVIAACLVAGIARRAAVFYLSSGIVVWMLLVWSYVISQLDIGWHLSTSVSRVVAGLMFICVAALLHLTGPLAASGLRRSRERSPDTTRSSGAGPARAVSMR